MTQTANTMSAAVGRLALVRFEQLSVECEVLDARQVFGRSDYLVRPTTGTGEQWVSRDRCTLADN